jgi:preprotein translocase subunit SecE
MKINWKVVIALVVVVGAIYLAVDSTRVSSYSGSNLTFTMSNGPVTITNPSNETIPVQLVGSNSRSFSVASATEGISGSPTRQGSGSNATYLYEFGLPSGVSELTISRGTNVNFVANTATRLEANVQSMTADAARTTIIVLAVVVLAALFYMSRATGHRWIGLLRGKVAPAPKTQPIVVSTGGQGPAIRAYGDNRTETGD